MHNGTPFAFTPIPQPPTATHPFLPTTRPQARKQQLPGVTLTLPGQGVPGSWVELVCHAADADGRAALLGVPALTMSAAAARAPELVVVNQHWRSRLLQQVGWEGCRAMVCLQMGPEYGKLALGCLRVSAGTCGIAGPQPIPFADLSCAPCAAIPDPPSCHLSPATPAAGRGGASCWAWAGPFLPPRPPLLPC